CLGIKTSCLTIPLIQGKNIAPFSDINQEAKRYPSVCQRIVDATHPIGVWVADNHIGFIGGEVITIGIYRLLSISINKILAPDHAIGMVNSSIYRNASLKACQWNVCYPAFSFPI